MTSVLAMSHHRSFPQKDLGHSYRMTQPLPSELYGGCLCPLPQESLNFFIQVFSSALQASNGCLFVHLGEQDE